MTALKIPKRISTALMNSLSAGVVPRIGLEYVAVDRKEEIAALLQDLENISEEGAAFRFIVGRYGSGKSFLLQLIRNYAMERDFVVGDCDLSPERRLTGSNGQALGTYREIMRNLSTKTRPEGGALAAILERWFSTVQAQVVKETGMRPNDQNFSEVLEGKILEVVNNMEGMVHGFDFAAVLKSYWQGYRENDDTMKDSALRWLRGEYSTKTEANNALGVRVIINDNSWYDYIKLFAKLVSDIGYKGMLVILDEAVNLYKITHKVSREGNYEKLLSVFNDIMQGKAESLGFLVGGTPQFVEDQRRGLYSYEALRSRLTESRFIRNGFRDTSGPILRLQTLSHEEIFVLLTRLIGVYTAHHKYENNLAPQDLQAFLQEAAKRLGAEDLLTPREIVRDFISILNILRQNPQVSFGQLIHGADFKPTTAGADPDSIETGEFSEFIL